MGSMNLSASLDDGEVEMAASSGGGGLTGGITSVGSAEAVEVAGRRGREQQEAAERARAERQRKKAEKEFALAMGD